MTETAPEVFQLMHKGIHINQNKGFSLMEVLIAMLILGVGLLGVAALQTVALKTNHSAYQRTQATFLAYDMMDRLRANRAAALAGEYELEMAQTPASSGPFPEQDLFDWINNYVSQLLPAGDGSVTCSNFGLCTVVVQWDESRTGGAATDGGGDILQFSFTAEI